MKTLSMIVGFLLGWAGWASATVLGDVAAQMQPGTWAELITTNISNTLRASGASGFVFGYTEDIRWDPVTEQLFYVGGDHLDDPEFITYSAQTNTWQREPKPYWLPINVTTGALAMHGYDHSAINPAAREFYHRQAFTRAHFLKVA